MKQCIVNEFHIMCQCVAMHICACFTSVDHKQAGEMKLLTWQFEICFHESTIDCLLKI
jgi:hypothetical protein